MRYRTTRPRTPGRAAAAGLLFLAAACGGGDAGRTDAAKVEEVDQKSSATATEREVASFRAPADSVLTPEQVNAFLRTTLLQFDLIRTESAKYQERAARMAERQEKSKGGVIAGMRDAMDAGSWMMGYADLVGGSYVRAARSQGHNPAEMEWVRERMGEVAGYLAMRPMYQMAVDGAKSMREQAEQYRGQPGFDEATIQQMLQSADEMEREAAQQMNASRSVTANMEVLRRAKPNVTDHMWTAVAFAGGGAGLLGLTGLAEPGDTTAQRTLNEWRRIYTDALENKVTPGLEADRPAGEARPRLDAEAPAS